MLRLISRCIPIALLVLVCIPVQGRAQRPIALGINVGLNIASQDFSIQSDTNRSTRTGLLVTGQTDWPLFGPAVLQDRLSYVQKGVVANRNSILTGTESVTTQLNYIELSLAAKIKFGMHEFKPYLFLGPRVGVLLSGTSEVSSGARSSSEDVRDLYQSIDFGLDMGAGFSYPVVPRLYFLTDVSYGLGLTNVLKSTVAGTNRAFSRDLKLQAGFMLEVWNVTDDH